MIPSHAIPCMHPVTELKQLAALLPLKRLLELVRLWLRKPFQFSVRNTMPAALCLPCYLWLLMDAQCCLVCIKNQGTGPGIPALT